MVFENDGRANVVLRTGNIIKGPKNYHELSGGLGKHIWDSCDKFGDKICQIESDTDEQETFSSFKSRATTVATHLKNLGIKKGDVILICTPNTLDSALPLAAGLFLGAISTAFDPSLSVRDCTHLLPIAQPKIIFTCPESVDLIEKTLAATDYTALVVVFGNCAGYKSFDEFLIESGEEDGFRPEVLKDEDPAFLLFSSGTSGLQKAICLSHKAIYVGAINFLTLINYAERTLHFTSFYWISATVTFIGAFSKGSTRVLISKFDPQDILAKMAKYKINGTFISSTNAYKLTNVKDIKSYDLSSLKTLFFGGSPIGAEQLVKLRALLPEVYMVVCYGMTEVSGIVTGFTASEKDLAYSCVSSCGRPLLGHQFKIVDPETEKSLGVNKPGEIRIKGDAMMLGYFNQDYSSAFDSEGFIKSGDIGHFDENGCIYVHDRIKDMFKYQSWHIVPASIESIILGHPDVQEAVIFGIPHEEDENLPAAAVKLRVGCDESIASDIQKFVAERVLDRQRLRGGVFIVEEMPTTPTGKLVRRKVREMILERLQNTNYM